MKKFKKALSLLTALIMAVSVINVSGIEAFAQEEEQEDISILSAKIVFDQSSQEQHRKNKLELAVQESLDELGETQGANGFVVKTSDDDVNLVSAIKVGETKITLFLNGDEEIQTDKISVQYTKPSNDPKLKLSGGTPVEDVALKEYAFSKDNVESVSIRQQPQQESYKVGDDISIPLASVSVLLKDNQGLAKEVPFSEFGEYNLTTSPSVGTNLTEGNHNQSIVVKFKNSDSIKAETESIKVFILEALKQIEFVTQPTLSYKSGDPIDLKPMKLTLTDNNDTQYTINGSKLSEVGLEASPAEGTLTTTDEHNGQPITISSTANSSFSPVNSDDLIVVKKEFSRVTGNVIDNLEGVINANEPIITGLQAFETGDVSVDTKVASGVTFKIQSGNNERLFKEAGDTIVVNDNMRLEPKTYKLVVTANHKDYNPKNSNEFTIRIQGEGISFNAVTANGSANTETTTMLTLTFDKDPGNLEGKVQVTGATVGEVSGSGTQRTVAISNITVNEGENVTVTLMNPAGKNITPLTKTVAVHKKAALKTTKTISINLPSALQGQVSNMEKTPGKFGFSVGENNPVTHVEIKDNKIILTLRKEVEEGSELNVVYNPTPEKGSLRLKNEAIKNFQTGVRVANLGLEIPRGFFRSGGSKINAIKIVDSNTPIVVGENFDINGSHGFAVELYDNLQTRSSQQGVKVTSVTIDRGEIFLGLNKSIEGTQLVRVIYNPEENQEENQKLYVPGRELTKDDIQSTVGVVGKDGTIVKPQPKADDSNASNSSRGFSGGRSSVRPNSPDRKSNDKKDIKMVNELPEIKPDSKVSTKLTIGDMKYTVVVDGQAVERTMDVAPMVHMGRTVLPARMISEILGVEVKYEPATRTASFMYGEEKVQLTLGQKFMLVNGKSMPLTADILNVNGRILLPLTDIQKAFAELGLKAKVDWDADTKSVTVNK